MNLLDVLGQDEAVGITAVSPILNPYEGIAATVVTYLLTSGHSSQAVSFQQMDKWTDNYAASLWHNPYSYTPNTQIFRQSCLDSELWYQYNNQEPATYNGLVLQPLVTLSNPGGRALFNTDYVLPPPIKMQIRNRTYDPGGGEGRCPKLFVNNGNGYTDFGVMAIHNPTGQDIVTDMSIKPCDIGINNYMAQFRLQEGWVGLTYSESVIDRVTLYAIDQSGQRRWCPLIGAVQSRLGNVLPQVYFSDGWKVQMFLLETLNLKFLVPYHNVQMFVFEIDGCNQLKQ
jgi:hypothetical protein